MKIFVLCFVNLLLPAAIVAVRDTNLCRCEAPYEHLYARRLAYYQNDYSRTHIDDDGYYIIDGVRVLPTYDDACVGRFGNRRALEERDDEDPDVEPLRALKSKGSKSKRSSKSRKKYCESCCILIRATQLVVSISYLDFSVP